MTEPPLEGPGDSETLAAREDGRDPAAEAPELVVEAVDIVKRFTDAPDERPVLDGASFEVRRGELLSLVGSSGSGKSTLLGIVGGLDRNFRGTVRVFGEDIGKLDDGALSRLRGSSIGFVFQAFHLLGHLSVLDNVTVPALFGPEDGEATLRARTLLARLGLEGRELDSPSRLSGGQRQRVAIARALLARPRLLLCDEPTGNLDRQTADQIAALFRELVDEDGITVVTATHAEYLARVADRVLRIAGGRIEPSAAAKPSEPPGSAR